MKYAANLILIAITLSLMLNGCGLAPSPTDTAVTLSPTFSAPAHTPLPQGKTIVVTNADDDGPGSLRQALGDAEPYDKIVFDPVVFPPDAPATIALTGGLPEITQGNLTIDASDAGVILDGSRITPRESVHGLSIASNNNIIRGLQITGFPDAGIGLHAGAKFNLIGGDRNIGDGLLGQGNLISGNGNFGIGLWDDDTSHNTIQGNYIGINIDGTAIWGHARDGIHSNGATQNLIIDNIIGGNEAAGVYLCCALDGGNTIANNLIGIGTDGSNLGNHLAGVLIDRTSHNVVGPGNMIAYNIGDGISFRENTPNNTVTQNSIRENGGQGIAVTDSQGALRPPIIINWNLQAGTLSGATCSNCTVEVFSDSGDEGAIYEGQVKADGNGAFHFTKGAPFTGPFLSSNTTTPDGSTSEFSPPTQGSIRILDLQDGDTLPILQLQTEPSAELADNRIGGTAETKHIDAATWNAGLKWMRVIMDSSGRWQHVDWEREEYVIDPEEEQVIDELLGNGVRIMLVLDVWETDQRVVYYKSEEDIKLYLNWIRSMVRHFKGRIDYYEILNEPDLSFEKPSGMPVVAYVNLVKRVVPVIREEDPEAKIVVGAVPDTRFDAARDWMWGLLRSEVMPLVDGISWHGMYGAAPTDDLRGVRDPESPQMSNYWENYPALVKEIKRVAISHGFQGEFLVEEMLWRTPTYSPHESEPYGFTDVTGAKYYARAIITHLGLDVTAGLAVVPEEVRPRSHAVIRALSTIMAGAEATDLPIRIESAAINIKYYAFTLPNGEVLVAIWTDGAAVEDDPGKRTTLTFPTLSPQKVIGVDVLHGFEQQIVTDNREGNLVVRDLFVKDYPIILRFMEASSP